MKYFREFNTEAELSAWQSSSEYAKPNVVLANGVIRYNIPKYGAYIQHIDGTLYDEDGWTNGGFSNDEANGIAVITAKASFVIAKNDLGQTYWSPFTLVDGILSTTDSAIALTDFAGYNNTQLMLATDTYTSGAGYSCANYTFPNGNKGYLPALGELKEAYNYLGTINSLMTKIGGTGFTSDYYWSSTQYSSDKSWRLWFLIGTAYDLNKDGILYVRAFSAL